MSTTESKRRSWYAKYTPGSRPSSSAGQSSRPGSSAGHSSRPSSSAGLPVPTEGVELSMTSPPSFMASSVNSSCGGNGASPEAHVIETPPHSRPSTPRRWSASPLLTSYSKSQHLDNEASQLIANALERTNSAQQSAHTSPKTADSSLKSGSFGRMAFSSMIGGLSSLSLTRTNTNSSLNSMVEEKEKEKKEDKERGRTLSKMMNVRSASQTPAASEPPSRSQSRARSQSPFSFRRFRHRETSPTPQPLPLGQSDVDLSDSASSIRPRNAFVLTDADDSGDDTVGDDGETEDDDWTDDDMFDPVTERNTERNAFIEPAVGDTTLPGGDEIDVDPDPLGEGVNVVVPPEPYFPSTLNYGRSVGGSIKGRRNPRRRKSVKHEPPPLQTSRPVFQRDRCTITITQGDPEAMLDGRRPKRYVVASDMSEESRYAVEWGIGTVIRDGDEMLIVTVVENESKVDPAIPNAADRAIKLRSQQERQGLAYILARQATGLLQRTKLNVTVRCQAWHAKNSRHMLLDIVDHFEPIMMIVGSRGVGQLKGILLGSTSNYLIQKCSVPVMVARRRLKRPPRRSAHLAKHRARVSLAEAGIDRVAAKVDQDVKVMRDEIQRDDDRRDAAGSAGRFATGHGSVHDVEEEADGEDEVDDEDDSPTGVKVAG
ncbi:uncharacterized protein EV420DRAFT_1517614 [Desarmillaria tabescens]|uniref:UspA domain-containing protein n=1 Tax=Armillaria tabescens TaxID=1929756 RepID=A0AA39TVL2_ARMTA|nr:uncharacterized protein EV420DRAFT_1517614 [Desarmillaria tabescens]KAK0464684.1 hypothetical protein EV420DRAFT_1517614 [Desarmillaria tabescens]